MNSILQETLTENTNILTTPTIMERLVASPNKKDLLEVDQRAPLKEISDNKDLIHQDQPEQTQEVEDSAEKITDYVAKVMEKLSGQKSKIAKMSAMIEKNSKGLCAQEIEEYLKNQEDDSEDDEDDNNDFSTKENMSPLKARYANRRGSGYSAKSGSSCASPSKPAQKVVLEDALQISRTNIAYGMRLPGQIVEERLEIVNTSAHEFIVQILVNCKNEELQDTEEYVFSVRRSHLYDYNDKHYLIMAAHSKAEFKFALKVPNMRILGTIEGEVDISIQGVSGRYLLDLSAEAVVPKVNCPKELKCRGLDYKVIKIAVKEGKKHEFKIPFKNNGPVPVTLDFEFYEPNNDSQERPVFDCLVHPNAVTIAANATTMAGIVVKPWKALSGMKDLGKQKPFRKILLGKVRDTALVYSFVFWIETC